MLNMQFDYGEDKNKQMQKLISEKLMPMIEGKKYGSLEVTIKNGNITACAIRETDNSF